MVLFQSCSCCGTCDVQEGSSGGQGTTVTTHVFPAVKVCIYFEYNAFYIPDQFIVEMDGNTVLDTGSVSGTGWKCFEKPEDVTSIQVTVDGPVGTAWGYSIKCGCPEPKRCCVDGDIPEDCVGSLATMRRCDPAETIAPCEVDDSPCEECDLEVGDTVPEAPPYTCLGDNRWGRFGIDLTVTGWQAHLGDRSSLTEEQLYVIEQAEWAMNRKFVLFFDCVGDQEWEIDLGGSGGTSSPCPGNWLAFLHVDACGRYASVTVSNPTCYDGSTVYIDLQSLPALQAKCNAWYGCNCQNYSGYNRSYNAALGEDVNNGFVSVESKLT